MMHSGIVAPKGLWWVPAGKQEKLWVTVAFIWCMILFLSMPFWHMVGGQNTTGVRSRVDPAAFNSRTEKFVQAYKVGEENGLPVVAPPAGSHVYIRAGGFTWYPQVLKLKVGVSYTIHLSSIDVNHGFSVFPINLNFQVVPGYDYALTMTPNEAGEYRVMCNEFCGLAHHTMVAKVIVEP